MSLRRGAIHQYILLMRLNRPIGIFLLLWPTLWALWIASAGDPDPWIATVFVLGVILMRSAGCVINDYVDRDIDPFVERTRQRPIAAGKIAPHSALLLFVFLSLSAFLLVLTLNSLTILMSFGGVVLAVIYPFMKRYTYLPQVFLGLAFGWAVPMAFAAQTGTVPMVAWLLLTATVLWATAYDTMYAMVDRVDDLQVGVKSTAILFGEADRLMIGIIQGLLLFVLILVGQAQVLGVAYYAGLVGALLLVIHQQRLIKNRDTMLCFKAFLNNNWFGAVVFAGIAVHYYLNT